MNNSRRLLTTVGYASLIILVGIIITLVLLHRLGLINAWLFPLKSVSTFLITASLSCFVIARIRGDSKTLVRIHRSQPKIRLKWLSSLLVLLLIGFIFINIPVYLLAYQMTHVRVSGDWGLGMTKPINSRTPSERGLAYKTYKILINQAEWLEAWLIPTQRQVTKGTVLLFPGNLGTKGNQLLAPAQSFYNLGYDTFLVDFRGVGDSSGKTITIGINEAEDVIESIEYAQNLGLKAPFVLYGISMGSAAILRAIATYNIQPDAIILELPFTRLVDAVNSRLQYYKFLAWIPAKLLIFWASIQHGVNGFTHNPIEYAKAVNCPVLLIHGEQDKWMSVAQIQSFFEQFKQPKQLVLSAQAGHQQLIGIDRQLWYASLEKFLSLL